MAEQLCKSKKQELISKRRQPLLTEMNEELEESKRRLSLHKLRIYGFPGDEQTSDDN